MLPKFTKGEKIKCIDPNGSNGALIEDTVYTASENSRVTANGELVRLSEIDRRLSWNVDRFEKVEDALKPGDWVRVTGQVVKADGPGDILVEFFSHNEQWSGWVEERRVIKAARPAWADEQCTAVTVNVLDTNVLYRCEKPEHRRFDKDHKSGKYKWVDGDNSGFFEEA